MTPATQKRVDAWNVACAAYAIGLITKEERDAKCAEIWGPI